VRTAAGLVAAAALLAGCGEAASPKVETQSAVVATEPPTTTAAAPKLRSPKVESHCRRSESRNYRMCYRWLGHRELPGTVEVTHGHGWRAVTRTPSGADVGAVWLNVWPSPGGRWLLLELGLECDVHRAFFAPAGGGPARPATGEDDWRTSPDSLPLGWAADGRAKVWVLGGEADCGQNSPEPGRYLIDPDSGRLDYVGKLPSR
jgi:hypothetical protein